MAKRKTQSLIYWALLLMVFLVLETNVQCYSVGADPSSCASMIPGHGADLQTGPSPYLVKVSRDSYSPGDDIQVTIESVCGDVEFKGFLIQARRSDSSQNTSTPIGQWTAVPGSKSICGIANSQGLTHDKPYEKLSVILNWTAPMIPQGHVHIRTSFVQDIATYWVNIDSPIIRDQSLTTMPNSKQQYFVTCPKEEKTHPSEKTRTTIFAPVSVQQTSGQLLPDQQCGLTKGCMNDCNQHTCTYKISWRDDGDYCNIEMAIVVEDTIGVWMAIGFSDDRLMGDDSVLACIANNLIAEVHHSYNDGKVNIPLMNSNAGINASSGAISDGVFHCKIQRKKSVAGYEKVFDLSKPWYLLFAKGESSNGKMYPHSLKADRLPVVSAEPVNFKLNTVIGGEILKFPLVKIHGCLMIAAWILCSTVGMVIARYFKEAWGDKTILHAKAWFQFHRMSMVATVLCTVTAFIVIFVESAGYSEIPDIPKKKYLKAHPVLGIITTSMCVLNPIIALFRPSQDSHRRPIFKWSHRCVGFLGQVLAVVCIFFGLEMPKAEAPSSTTYALIAFIAYFAVFTIVQEIVPKLEDRYYSRRVMISSHELASPRMSTASDLPLGEVITAKPKKESSKRCIVLGLHIGVTVIFATVIIILLVVG